MINYSTNTLIISIILLISIIPIVIFGFYFIDEEKKLIEKQQTDNLREIVASQKDKITNYFDERLSDVIISSNLPFVQNNIKNLFGTDNVKKSISLEILKSVFENIRTMYGYNYIWIVNNDLQTHFAIGVDLSEPSKPLDLPLFSKDVNIMKKGLYLSDVYPDPFLKTSEMFVSVPIIVDDKQLGYLIYDINVHDFFKDTLFELELSNTGETVLVQSDGENIRILNSLRFLPEPKMSMNEMMRGIKGPTYKALFDVTGSGITTDYRLKDVLAAWDYIPLTRWGIVAKIDSSEAFSSIIEKEKQITLIVGILIVSSFVVGLSLSRIATTPLKKIENAATKIMQKNYDVIINPTGPVEQKTIAKSFNEMTKTLKININELEYFKLALDSSTLVAITDVDGILIYANDKFCKVSKYSSKELLGKTHSILKSDFYDDSFYENLWKTITSGKTWQGTIKNKAKDGSFYWINITIVPIFNDDRKIERYITVGIDITEQVELSEQLLKTEKLSTIGELSARIAHDLRNPLSVIKNIVYLFESSKNPEISKYILPMKRSIERMEHQINDVLNFAKNKPLSLAKYSISGILKDSIQTQKIPDNIQVTVMDNDTKVMADSIQLESAFSNVIRNSIESIGDEKGTITITVTEKQNDIVIEIVDSGVLNADINRIFEPLYTTKMTGTGLGLASCKSIIENHGGQINVTYPPTTFTVTLPKTQQSGTIY